MVTAQERVSIIQAGLQACGLTPWHTDTGLYEQAKFVAEEG